MMKWAKKLSCNIVGDNVNMASEDNMNMAAEIHIVL